MLDLRFSSRSASAKTLSSREKGREGVSEKGPAWVGAATLVNLSERAMRRRVARESMLAFSYQYSRKMALAYRC